MLFIIHTVVRNTEICVSGNDDEWVIFEKNAILGSGNGYYKHI